MHHLKYAARQIRLHPGFALTAVVSLALGIGANTAIFTLVDQILLRLLPVRNPRELVQLRLEGGRTGSQSGDGLHTFSYPLYRAFRDRNTVFTGLTGQVPVALTLVGADRGEMLRGALVAGNFFEVLGVRPHLGRMLTEDDSRAKNTSPVAVLQFDFWLNRFGGRAGVIGSTVRLNGCPFTVVGVAAPGFEGTDAGVPTHVWAPVTMRPTLTPSWDELENERWAWFYLFGRLKPGVSIEQAQAEIKVIYRQRQQEELKADYFAKYPETKERFLRGSPTLIPAARGQSSLRRGFERPLIVLQCLVAFVLLIACTNVANLLLARAVARQREVAIRASLGAGRGHLIRQLLTESLVLAAVGGVAGLFLSSWIAKVLVRFLPADPSTLSLSTAPDMRVLVFTAAVVLITVVLFGLVPALRGSRVAPGAALKEESGAVAGAHAHVRLRKALVGLQVALSCLLLIGAGLFARTIQNLRRVDLGLRTENVIMFGVRTGTIYPESRKLQTYRALIEGVAAVPGVRSAGANAVRLLTGGRSDSSITIPGVEPKQGNQPWSFFNAVTPGYFETLGIPVKTGRDVTWADWAGGRRICLVNEALVREYLDGANPVGRMMAMGTRETPDMEIVGVFGDARYHEVRGAVPRQVVVPVSSRLRTIDGLTVYARAQGDPRQVMGALRDQVRRIDPDLVVSEMRPLDDQVNMRLSNERLLSFLSAGFALLASLLAAVGLHGVLAFVAARRTREIGIRMALGAKPGQVVYLVMREMLPVIAVGLVIGAGAGLACGRFVEAQLFGVKAMDAPVFVISVMVLLLAALAAAFLPAWRASRIDPVTALRWEQRGPGPFARPPKWRRTPCRGSSRRCNMAPCCK